jgi:hypothetical protein
MLHPQTNRSVKLFTYVACVGVSFYSVFYAQYNPNDPREHCFTDIQRWYHSNVNKFLLSVKAENSEGVHRKMGETPSIINSNKGQDKH